MRGATRACRRLCREGGHWPLVSVAFVAAFAFFADGLILGEAHTHRVGSFLLNWWLLTLLGTAFLAWTLLRARYSLDEVTGAGFLLASFGLACRFLCGFVVYTLPASAGHVYGGTSLVEESHISSVSFLVAANRYGGLTAVAAGLCLVAWSTWRELRLRQRG